MPATALQPITLQQPPRITIGEGCRYQVTDYLRARNVASILLVCSRSTRMLVDDLVLDFRSSGIDITEAPPTPPEPTFADARAAIAAVHAARPDAVVACGGGSVIDVAKIAAACAEFATDPLDFVGNGLLPPRRCALVALPTTAGAGSEVSPNAIFLDTAAQLKKGIISPWLVPDAAFVDPELSLALPPLATASTALDALSHCIEAFANKNAQPAVDLYALEGARLIFEYLPRAMADGQDREARSALARGSLYGGLCLGPVNTAAIHALSYPLGSRFHVPHGLANALLMPRVLRFNAETCPERYAAMAVAFGVSTSGSTTSRAAAVIDAIEQLCRSCRIPMKLSELQVPRHAIPDMAAAALQITRLLVNNLREVTRADAESIYQDSF